MKQQPNGSVIQLWYTQGRFLTGRGYTSKSYYYPNTRVLYEKGYHGGIRAKDTTVSPDQRSATEKCLLCSLSDSADHWLHLCPFRGLRIIRDSVMSALQTAVTDLRHQGPLKSS